MPKAKKKYPTDEEGNRLPPEERWALIDGPWDQKPIHSRWDDLADFMEAYGDVVDKSSGMYFFKVMRTGLNEDLPEADRYVRTIFPKVTHPFDERWLEEQPEGGGGKYSIDLMGPKIDKSNGKEHKGSGYVARFYKLQIPGDPNSYKPGKKTVNRRSMNYSDDDLPEPYYNPDTGAWEVAKQMARSSERAREEQMELLREQLERRSESRDDHQATVELARVIADQKQHSTDASSQMMMAFMQMQSEMMKAQLNREPVKDNSKELDSLMRMLDAQKSDARAALEEERNRSRMAQDQQRQIYLDQVASIKEDRDRRERELKDELEKARAEARDLENRLESVRSELSTVKLEKVSAEVKATLGGQSQENGGLAGFRKTLKEVRDMQEVLGMAGGGGDEGGDWKEKLLSAVTDPRVAAAAGGLAQGVVGAFSRPQMPAMMPNPALPPMQVQQIPDPAQQAWQQQQAQLQAQRQAAAQPQPPSPEPPKPQEAKPVQEAAEEPEEKTFEEIIEEAAEGGVDPEAFLKQVLAQFNVTLEDARKQAGGQSLEQVVAVLGIDLEKLNLVGREYVKDIYQVLQRTV